MNGLPEGVVTFVFTDIEGSTRLWDDAPDTMMSALQQHDDAIDSAVSLHHGVSVKPRGEGDSRFIVFSDASDAVGLIVFQCQIAIPAVAAAVQFFLYRLLQGGALVLVIMAAAA